MTRRDAVGNTSTHDLVRQLAVAPVADWSAGTIRLLAGECHNLAYLLWAQAWLYTGSGRVCQASRSADLLERQPAPGDPPPTPQPDGFDIHRQASRDVSVAVPQSR
jgi:hypothetical protein